MSPKSLEILLKDTKISQVISRKIISTGPSVPLKDAVALMQSEKAGYVLIEQDKKPLGIFTETDLAMKVLDTDADWMSPISNFMTKEPIVLTDEDSIEKAIHLMGRHVFWHLPLVDQSGKLTGILSVRALIRFLAEHYPAEVLNLPPDPNQIMSTQEGG